MNKETHQQNVIQHYNGSIAQYKRFGKLVEAMALRTGYWTKDTNNLTEALINQARTLYNHARPAKTDKVLDAGCGVGGCAILFAKEAGCRVTGITLVSYQVSMAQEFAQKNGVSDLATFQISDFGQTGFETASFDIIYAMESVSHAFNKVDFIQEASRLLKPGGKLLICDYFNTKEEYHGKESVVMQRFLESFVMKLWTTGQFQSTMQRHGFKNIDIQDNTPLVRKTMFWIGWVARFGMIYMKIIRFIGFKPSYDTPVHQQNLIGCLNSAIAYNRKLWKHCIIYAERS